MSCDDFTPKDPDEKELFTFNFTKVLQSGETISTAQVFASVKRGSDASPQLIVSGSAIISGARVAQLIINGVLGVTYRLVCRITTSLGQTIELGADLLIQTK